MRAAVLEAGTVSVQERPEPKAHRDLVKVEVLVAPMCTEYLGRRSGDTTDVLGHEAVGVVVDEGESTRVRRGDRVVVMPQYGCGVCRYCTAGEHIHCPDQRDVLAESGSDYGTATYAGYLLKPDWLLLPVPGDVSLRHAAMTVCGLGPGFTAMTRMRVDAFDTVLVAGCGPVGLGAIVNARARGARVVAIEVNPFRAALAERAGAEAVVDPTKPGAEERLGGADAAVDTTGVPAVFSLMTGALRPLGRVATVAWGAQVPVANAVPQGIELHGCWHWNHHRYADRMWQVVRRSPGTLDEIVTHHFDLTDVAAAMDVQDGGRCGKVFLYPHGQAAAS